MIAEYQLAGEPRYDLIAADLPGYFQRAVDDAAGVNLPAGHVPQNHYWLVGGERIFGGVRLRHRLTPRQFEWGCHIGYDIRPAERCKGYGTTVLRLVLEKARNLGLSEVYLTCAADNIASSRVIRKNDGQLDGEYFLERVGHLVQRYRIQL